jgi:hypothetical protein
LSSFPLKLIGIKFNQKKVKDKKFIFLNTIVVQFMLPDINILSSIMANLWCYYKFKKLLIKIYLNIQYNRFKYH